MVAGSDHGDMTHIDVYAILCEQIKWLTSSQY